MLVTKSTKYVGKKTIVTIPGILMDSHVDGTVQVNGEMYRVAQITDIIEEKPRSIHIIREIKVVNKVYY